MISNFFFAQTNPQAIDSATPAGEVGVDPIGLERLGELGAVAPEFGLVS